MDLHTLDISSVGRRNRNATIKAGSDHEKTADPMYQAGSAVCFFEAIFAYHPSVSDIAICSGVMGSSRNHLPVAR